MKKLESRFEVYPPPTVGKN